MKLCVIAQNYKTESNHVHVFLDNIIKGFVDRGIECDIIAPQSIFSLIFRNKKARKLISKRMTEKNRSFFVFSPIYMVYPKRVFGRNTSLKTMKSFTKAVLREYNKRKLEADVVYAHFIRAGIAGVELAKAQKIPSFIANGESDISNLVENTGLVLVKKTILEVTGIISVSTKNKSDIIDVYENNEIENKIIVVPNAIETTKFYKKDRYACRELLGLPQDKFIVIFVGSFIERKGSMRLSAALDELEDVYSIFVGTGVERPTCNRVLFSGRVENSKICDYLNAANVFVLPTLAEGCSNAIVEALACGLPVISSNLPFNDDILDDSCSVRIDPKSIQQIKEAILDLQDHPERGEALSQGSLEKARSLQLDKRVDRIVSFIREKSVNGQ